ncbi:hypothetical protein KQX54_000050 [Cotesia glomerata]|uniref:Uncharacterized protein n=1 Tax=Cotesia glomerata TaxID=32391 RepID=A0AAV7HUS6_COTGL|nr:hypothetical protein KQX54_000050 [Cotesia glomerata]
MKKRVSCLVPVVWTPEVIQKKYLDPPKDMEGYVLITDADKLKFDQLCLHFQTRRKINYVLGGEDDPEYNSKTWLGRRCTELRNAWKQKNKVHQAPRDG